VARTYVIDPSKGQEAQYRALLDAQAAAIAALVDGAPLSAAHAAATAALQARGPGGSRARRASRDAASAGGLAACGLACGRRPRVAAALRAGGGAGMQARSSRRREGAGGGRGLP